MLHRGKGLIAAGRRDRQIDSLLRHAAKHRCRRRTGGPGDDRLRTRPFDARHLRGDRHVGRVEMLLHEQVHFALVLRVLQHFGDRAIAILTARIRGHQGCDLGPTFHAVVAHHRGDLIGRRGAR